MILFNNNFLPRDKIENKILILNESKTNNIIYGAQSIKKHVGFGSRPTQDFDIMTNNPKQMAEKTENNLEKFTPKNSFYVKKGLFPGLYKVKSIGPDKIKDTKDDITFVDYSKMHSPKPISTKIDNNNFRVLNEEKAAKLKALKDDTQKFRHKKDRIDYNIIKNQQKMNNIFRLF